MDTKQIVIKKATVAGLPVLLALSKETFFEFFGPLNDPANMEAYSAVAFTSQKMLSELANPGSEFYFALLNNQIVGYLKLNFNDAQTEFKTTDTMEIERIYITGSHHGKSFGYQLLSFAIETAKARKLSSIWLGVWDKNRNAIDFYTRNGFTVFSNHEFLLGNDRQNRSADEKESIK